MGGLTGLVLYFARLGTVGFGGPIALAARMRRELVEERGWIRPQDYSEGLALAQLAPGPLAAQLAIYLGWVRGGTIGATLVGVAFVLPSLLMVMALAWAYVRFGGLPWMAAAFYGIGAAVVAIIARSAAKLARATVGRDRLLLAIFAVALLVTAVTERELILLFLGSGLLALLVKAPPRLPRWGAPASVALAPLVTGLSGPASPATLGRILLYFAESGTVVF